MVDDSCSGQIDSNLFQKILDEVAVGFEEQLRFTMDLMRHPSLRGQEHTAQNFFYDALDARGYEMDRWTCGHARRLNRTLQAIGCTDAVGRT